MNTVHPIFQEILCSFGAHEWEDAPFEGKYYDWSKCKHCPAEKCEEK